MPWTASQAKLLRQLGVHWVGAASTGLPIADAQPVAAGVPGVPQAAGAGLPSQASSQVGRPQVPERAAPPAQVPAEAAPAVAASQLREERLDVFAQLDGLDWPSLRTAVQNCRACALCQTRTQTVFGVGHTSAHWMVVGEAPGEQEDLRGEPFVGAAGRLLDQMLAALQLTRRVPEANSSPPSGETGARQVYIANTLKCRPPGNRNPQPEELARCEPFLQRQIALLQPRIILAMGRFAVQSLLRSTEPVGKLRGRVHRYQGVPLIVTYHPAYLLRNPMDKARAWDDLCLAAATYDGPRAADPSRKQPAA